MAPNSTRRENPHDERGRSYSGAGYLETPGETRGQPTRHLHVLYEVSNLTLIHTSTLFCRQIILSGVGRGIVSGMHLFVWGWGWGASYLTL